MNNILGKFREIETPFYYYDLDILRSTLEIVSKESQYSGYKVHYALKANSNPRILKIISSYGLGADCVSWNEIAAALEAGFSPSGIVFAGVGKTDKDIEAALKTEISCFNCESIPEIEVISGLASKLNKTAPIALRINPYIEAHTHKYITTGIEESKFGINTWEIEEVLKKISTLKNVRLIGIHFHIGSQITRMSVFKSLCARINELQEWFSAHGIDLSSINVGGGLGIDYENPEKNPLFEEYFSLLHEFIRSEARTNTSYRTWTIDNRTVRQLNFKSSFHKKRQQYSFCNYRCRNDRSDKAGSIPGSS